MSCCQLQKLQYHHNQETQVWPAERHRYRAGIIFLDYNEKKVLVVQSYCVHWGFPKGSKNVNETFKECAIRELFEETGIRIHEEDIEHTIQLYNGTVKYYIVQWNRRFHIDCSVIDTSEISGIGWICVQCLKQRVDDGEMLVNCHVRKLLSIVEREFMKTPV
jgi:8-oxo-dGTP pyrophosphatase MutT (NUDIX family)